MNNSERGWHIVDLHGRERELADKILEAFFHGEPGSAEALNRFDQAICRKYGFRPLRVSE